MAVVVTLAATTCALGQTADDEDFDVLPAGLVGAFFAEDGFAGASHVRVDDDVLFDWGQASPDPRVRGEPFSVRWQGQLFVETPGAYRFYLHQAGQSRLTIGDAVVVVAKSGAAAWAASDVREFDFGVHRLRLEYRATGRTNRVGLYWSGPGFALEPVPPDVLFHNETPAAAAQFARGHDLVRGLRCDRCHSIGSDGASVLAPALAHVGTAMSGSWLRAWLKAPRAQQPHARMPAFDWTDAEVEAIAAYLESQSKPFQAPRHGKKAGDRSAGARLFRSRGCLACHAAKGLGRNDLFSGGDLSQVGGKRSPAALRSWLTSPAATNADHRMPVFALSSEEVEHLVAYLSSLAPSQPARDSREAAAPAKALFERGRDLIAAARCAACHHVPGFDVHPAANTPLHSARQIDWADACTGEPDRRTRRPGYRLDAADRAAVRAYVEALPAEVHEPSAYARGADLLRRRGCTACHPRGRGRGLVETAGRVSELESSLAGLSAAMVAPSLNAAGDKLRRTFLEKAVAGEAPRRLAWLKVAMPKFRHSATERDAIVDYLIAHDRIPAGAPVTNEVTADLADHGALVVAGQDLVGRGFACTACHEIGDFAPRGVALATRGSDLVGLGQRMRRSWFSRWMQAPLRITGGVEMPAYVDASPGVLDGNLAHQLEAIWTALNDPAFVAPTIAGVVEQDVVVPPAGPAEIIRDVFLNGAPHEGWTPRALAVGLNNRHNLLFDLETFSLRKWWYGDFARQRTRGKTWLWEPAGTALVFDEKPHPALAIERDGKVELPLRERQTVGWLHEWRRGARLGEASFSYRLRFADGLWLDVTETITPYPGTADGPRTGFTRSMRVRGLPARVRALWLQAGEQTQSSRVLEQSTPLGKAALRLNHTADGWRTVEADGLPEGVFAAELESARGEASGAVTWSIGLRLAAPVREPVLAVKQETQRLDVLDGFEAVRLALDDHLMPTGFAWRPDGTLVIASLRGDVLLARDTDGDGLEDELTQFADHLAAPYGVLADGDDILVSHKPEVVRLRDTDGDGRADQSEVVATGWGYTDNYHDWTVGLVRDAQRNLYVVLGSDYQQRGRLEHTTQDRGHVLRIAPDGTVTTIATGLRFACGIAMSPAGDLFCTDNQGEQNCFNEINHIVPGGFYGVPALYDRKLTPAQQPVAVQVPHPATRSVNGIVFIPADNQPFAAFAGQGIGCEYDLKALIRFSVQKVGDTVQGATYPFTRPQRHFDPRRRSETDRDGLLGAMCAGFSPRGDLYVGMFLDSGWLGGPNRGGVVRIRPAGALPTGIREVRAETDGFTIDFTGPVDSSKAADPASYTLSAYRRVWQGSYATPDRDRHTPRITRVEVANDAKQVRLRLQRMEAGFLYDIAVKPIAANAKPLWPATAHYTLNRIPE